MNNDNHRKLMEEQVSHVGEERKWWDKKKSSIQEEFMKELEEDSLATKVTVGTAISKDVETAATPAAAPAVSVQGSDDDAVLVEAASSTPASPPSGKKKKGKGRK